MSESENGNVTGNVSENGGDPILVVEGLKKYYPVRGGILGGKIGEVRAVDGVSFTVREGETWDWWGVRLR